MKALILLGCPETPSQTPLSIYATNKLVKMGYEVTIAANPAASKLVKVSDPDNHYLQNMVDLDHCLNDLDEGQFDLLLGFVHKDAAASFFVTFNQILQCESIALVFERDIELVEEFSQMISEYTDAKVVAVKAFHNPTPIKVKLDKALKEL
ncbi:MAG: DUF1890 domain-containing protein [archaeon]|nr:DUF1890 domain-containing protein [archaeon]